ncbi:hypothetical protein EV174_005654, partial [Coemansia sp. RSA 2320]
MFGSKHPTTNCDSSLVADDVYSVQSMFDIGKQQTPNYDGDGSGGDVGNTSKPKHGESRDVVLPLNDLYLLQKYLAIYEDSWAPGEVKHAAELRQQSMATDAFTDALKQQNMRSLTPMAECLGKLGPAPTQ